MRKRKKNVVYNLISASKSAMISGIEIHNKPQFNYRYPTVSMLFINAWELVLKAYIYKYISKKQIYEKQGNEVHTISFSKALTIVKDNINEKLGKNTFKSQFENLNLIEIYRNTNVHYFEEELDPAIFMLLSKNVLNYVEFLKHYFSIDITENNDLVILPIGFKLPFNPINYLNKDYKDIGNDFVSKIIDTIKQLNDEGIEESIIVGFNTFLSSIKKITNSDIIAALDNTDRKAIPVTKAYRLTNDPGAPAVKAEDILPEYEYKDYVNEICKRIPYIKRNNYFYEIYKKIKCDNTLCIVRYLNPAKKDGAKKPFFTKDAVDKFIELYNNITA